MKKPNHPSFVWTGILSGVLLILCNCSPARLAFPIDPCALPQNAETPQEISLNVFGSIVRVFITPSVTSELPEDAAVVLIVNGNGYDMEDYTETARFLAANNFITAIAIRPGSFDSSVEEFVIGALNAVFQELNLSSNTPVVLIGHSVGGEIVCRTAIYNFENSRRYNIKALIGLAPTFSDIPPVNGNHAASFLSIYGSQDEDVEGDNNQPSEAFAAFDATGTEDNTTCTGAEQFCILSQPVFERIMIYIHGASHAGIINRSAICLFNQCDPNSAYLSQEDQFCITRGYINAYLRWILRRQIAYKSVIYGQIRPVRYTSMTTSGPDFKGNPAGHPLHLSFQASPAQKRVIENFEDQEFSLHSQSDGINLQLISNLSLADAPNYVRHRTNYLAVGWTPSNALKSLGFNVPASAVNTRHFSHLAFRVGQLNGNLGEFTNPLNTYRNIRVCMQDAGGVLRCVDAENYGRIPPSDPQPDGVSHSVMNTIAIPLDAFNGIDRNNIRVVGFGFPANSNGTLIFDNIEWWRN